MPIIEVGRKRLVQRELAEKALGLDYAELLLEIHRHHEWMARREVRADGRRKTVTEYAEETTWMAQQALAEAEQR